MLGGVELACDNPGDQAGIGGKHLVGTDHREPVAERHDDRSLDPGQFCGQDHVFGQVHHAAVEVVVPVDAEEIQRVGGVAVDPGQRGPDVGRDQGGVGQLGEGGQDYSLRAEALDAALVAPGVDDLGEQPEPVPVEGPARIGRTGGARFDAAGSVHGPQAIPRRPGRLTKCVIENV